MLLGPPCPETEPLRFSPLHQLHQLHQTCAPCFGAHRLPSLLPESDLIAPPGAAVTSYPTRRRRVISNTSINSINWRRPTHFVYPIVSLILSSAGTVIISARMLGVSRLTYVDRCMPVDQ